MDVVVGGVLAIAVYTDLSRRKIPNWLTMPLWGVGLFYYLIVGPWWAGLLAIAVLFPVHFLLFAIGMDRGGDAKLVIGIGACLGWWLGIEATIWSILLMLPVGLVYATLTGRLLNVWRTFAWLFRSIVYRTMQLDPGEKPESTFIPKAPVIAVAVLVARFTPWLDQVLLSDEWRAVVQ
jgi:prepilin peptidase CpaA